MCNNLVVEQGFKVTVVSGDAGKSFLLTDKQFSVRHQSRLTVL